MWTSSSAAATCTRKASTGWFAGIGIGVPGIVDPAAGIARDYTFIRAWQNVPPASRLREMHGAAVTLDNNLRAIALAERWFGGAAELSGYVILGPRSGFGIALVIGGRIVTGMEHSGGEIGRWPWQGGVQLHDALAAPACRRIFIALSPCWPVSGMRPAL